MKSLILSGLTFTPLAAQPLHVSSTESAIMMLVLILSSQNINAIFRPVVSAATISRLGWPSTPGNATSTRKPIFHDTALRPAASLALRGA